MKKIFSILVCCMFVLMANAQIKRSVYGITLGSDGASAKKVLQDKGLRVETGTTELGYTIVGSNPIFSGVQWDYVIVTINKGKVYSVMFMKEKYEFDDDMPTLSDHNGIRDVLEEKYKDYKVNPSEYDMNPDAFLYEDEATRLLLLRTHERSKSELMLAYLDFEGAKKRNEAIYDEL